LAEKGLSFTANGTFVPSFYKKFPAVKPILYTESFNPKKSFEASKKLMQSAQKSAMDLGAFYKQAIGIDVEAIYNTFDKEMAFAVQENGPVPYFTMMGNVANNRAAAEKLATDTAALVKKLLLKNRVPRLSYSYKQVGNFTYFTFDLSKLSKKGNPLPKTTFVMGVTEDNLFVISNYPNIEKKEMRIGNGGLFASAGDVIMPSSPVSGLAYMNFRNIWDYVDGLYTYAKTAKKGKFAISAREYASFNAFLDKIYGFKDMMVTIRATETTATVDGDIVFDDSVGHAGGAPTE
jgi:hypothetical protein